MPFSAFHTRFPTIAARETRNVLVARDGRPSGQGYVFVELFCDEPGCDCRRVMFSVVDVEQMLQGAEWEPLATITYGWEDEDFYESWASFPLSADDLAELRGPALAPMGVQSDLAPHLLEQCKLLLSDPTYVERIIRHYQVWRRSVDGRRGPVEKGRARRRRTLARKSGGHRKKG